jgi:signal transduction histidine kinase
MRSLLPRTIGARLILSHLLVSVVSIALISLFAGNVLLSAARKNVEHRYQDMAFAASNYLEQPLIDLISGEGSQGDIEAALAQVFAGSPEVHYTIFLPDGAAVFDSSGVLPSHANPGGDPEIWESIESRIGQAEMERINAAGDRSLYVAVRVEHSGTVYGVLRIDVPLSVALDSARQSLVYLIGIALIVALSVSGVGYFLARSIAVPIEGMTETAESLSRGELSARVAEPTNLYEMHRLAEALNKMAGRLQALVSQLRSFVANASHELRTPLTSIKLRVEALRNGALDDPPVTEQFLSEIESEVDRLSKMVNDMLDLSRIEVGLEMSQRSVVDLASVVKDVYLAFKSRADSAGVDLVYKVDSSHSTILGDEDQLRRMLYNLVDNAIKYTPYGGRVELSLQDDELENTILLVVKDTGFGIAEAQLPHVFERFYRVEATRPRYGPPQGSGLGLSITKSIAENHGGNIAVTSQVGKGSTFVIQLPAQRNS